MKARARKSCITRGKKNQPRPELSHGPTAATVLELHTTILETCGLLRLYGERSGMDYDEGAATEEPGQATRALAERSADRLLEALSRLLGECRIGS
jgi:hypothetical protein